MSAEESSRAEPRVSVIMANYNGAAHIAAAVNSVLGQTEPSLELIVSDDGSSDGSLGIARAAAGEDTRLVVLETEQNSGPAAARNRALARARGRWVAIVDNDDHIELERLARLIGQAEADGADIAADNMMSFYEGGRPTPHLHLAALRAPAWIDAATYIRGDVGEASFGYLKPIFRRSSLGTRLRYDETLTIGEDSHLVTQLLLSGARMRLYPEAGYHYRKRTGSISHRQNAKALDAMIAALDALDAGGDAAAANALRKRRASLRDARVFLDFVNALKARDLATAARVAVQHPQVIIMLREPIMARLRPR